MGIRGVYLGFLNVYEVSPEERRGRKWGTVGAAKIYSLSFPDIC